MTTLAVHVPVSAHDWGRLRSLAEARRATVTLQKDRAGNHVVTLRGQGWERSYSDPDLSEAIRFASEREVLT